MNTITDILILGAGVNGLSIAYELCKRGKKVVVAEKSEMGAGASGSCDDMILLQSKKPGILLTMAFGSLELFKTLKGELPCDIEFDTRGGMILIEDEEQLRLMEGFVANQRSYGLEVEIVDRKRTKALQPLVSDHVIASTYSARDSQVNPLLLMKGFFLGASARGMTFLRGATPEAVTPRAGRWETRFVSGDRVESGAVIDAAGAWAGEVSDLVGLPLPIIPRKGQVMVTEQIPQIGATNVWSAKYIASKLKPIAAARDDKATAARASPAERYGLGFALTGTHSGNYLVGSTRENVGFDRGTDPEALGLMARQVEHFFPVLANINFIRSFAGLRPSTTDGMPVIGEAPGNPGFFIAAGHEGDGIALAPITGKIVADLVEGRPAAYPLGELSPGRFAAAGKGKA
jgi:glycine/D-amino acid oxidase-like deaminating enzyme